MVTLAISTNIIISLGMVGALSIVRYRTAVKEPLDLMYMFWAITVGITVGASMYILAVAASVIVILILVVMHKNKNVEQTYLYIIHYDDAKTYDEIIRILGKTSYLVRSQILRGTENELTLEIRPGKGQTTLVERINALNHVNDITAVQYNGEYHG